MRLLLLIGLVCIGCYFWGTKEARLSRALGDRLGCQVSIERFSFRPFGTLKLQKVSFSDPTGRPILDTPQITLKYSVRDLIRSPHLISKVEVENARISQEGCASLLKLSYPESRLVTIEDFTLHTASKNLNLSDLGGLQGSSLGEIGHVVITKLVKKQTQPSPSRRKEKVSPDILDNVHNLRHHLHAF